MTFKHMWLIKNQPASSGNLPDQIYHISPQGKHHNSPGPFTKGKIAMSPVIISRDIMMWPHRLVYFRLFSHFSIHCHSYSVSDTIGLYIAMMRKLVQPIRTILQHFATVICYWLFSHFLIFRRQWSRFWYIWCSTLFGVAFPSFTFYF